MRSKSLTKLFISNGINKSNINNKIHKKLKYFDVSLRDGLQSIKECYTLHEKKELLKNIIKNYNPQKIEIGSIVNPSVLPQMNNSLELYQYADKKYKNIDFYLLIPSFNKFMVAQNNDIKNISLITSVSNKFQLKNTSKDLEKQKEEFLKMKDHVHNFDNVKLYVSCINQCPIQGKINIDFILHEIEYYKNLNMFDEFCLSDTCGNINYEDFKNILDETLKIVPDKCISLHMHRSQNDMDELKKMIRYAYSKNIYNYDVSALENVGGCSVSIEKNNLVGNINYSDLLTILR